MNDNSGWPISAPPTNALRRELGRWDLALLFVVAILNLNTVSSIATSGPLALWLWLAALLCFFLPQGIAVIELSHRYPGEGGLYLWSKEVFGDFHGFIVHRRLGLPDNQCFLHSLRSAVPARNRLVCWRTASANADR